MDGLYAEYVARSIAKENIHHQGSITLETFHNPFVGFSAFVNKIVTAVKEKFQVPALEPIDCIEYAADCS